MLAYISAYAFKTGVYMHDNQLFIQEHEVSKLGLGSYNDLKGFRQCTPLKKSTLKEVFFNQKIFKYIGKSIYFTSKHVSMRKTPKSSLDTKT